MLITQLKNYAQLIRLDKPIGILLLLWPTLWALWIANHGLPPIKILFIFIVGVVVMRSAGCVINDIADRNIDGFVKRTAQRPLASGAVSLKEALIIFILLCCIALILVLMLNRLAFWLSIIGLLLTIIYPFCKRFLVSPQLILGITFAWGVPMAFAASLNQIPTIAWWIYLIAVLWPIAYDTEYAMVDRSDDEKIGVRSTAIWFGKYDCLIIGILQTLVLIILFLIGMFLNYGITFYVSIILSGLLFSYQQKLIKSREPNQCFKAFLNNHWVGLIIWLGLALSY